MSGAGRRRGVWRARTRANAEAAVASAERRWLPWSQRHGGNESRDEQHGARGAHVQATRGTTPFEGSNGSRNITRVAGSPSFRNFRST